jgi:thymidylate synthase
MAELFTDVGIARVWAKAARRLYEIKGHTAQNFLLEISSPTRVDAADVKVISMVDQQLRASADGLTIATVAGTLFPNGLYRRYARPDFYAHFLAAIEKGKDVGTWGTYARRMVDRIHPKSGEHYNPLDTIVEKLRRASEGRHIHAAYELGVVTPYDLPDGFELPLYDPATDGRRPTNIPCLSHLSFKFNDAGSVDLTAMYRSHHYGQRALGNLLGLSQLLAFVSKEAGLDSGALTCLSTQAHLDVKTFGGERSAGHLITAIEDEFRI